MDPETEARIKWFEECLSEDKELKAEFVKLIATFQFKIQSLELQHREEKQRLEMTVESMRQKFRAVQHLAANIPSGNGGLGQSPIYGSNMPPSSTSPPTFGPHTSSGAMVDSRPRHNTVSGSPPKVGRDVASNALRPLPSLPQPMSEQVKSYETRFSGVQMQKSNTPTNSAGDAAKPSQPLSARLSSSPPNSAAVASNEVRLPARSAEEAETAVRQRSATTNQDAKDWRRSNIPAQKSSVTRQLDERSDPFASIMVKKKLDPNSISQSSPSLALNNVIEREQQKSFPTPDVLPTAGSFAANSSLSNLPPVRTLIKTKPTPSFNLPPGPRRNATVADFSISRPPYTNANTPQTSPTSVDISPALTPARTASPKRTLQRVLTEFTPGATANRNSGSPTPLSKADTPRGVRFADDSPTPVQPIPSPREPSVTTQSQPLPILPIGNSSDIHHMMPIGAQPQGLFVTVSPHPPPADGQLSPRSAQPSPRGVQPPPTGDYSESHIDDLLNMLGLDPDAPITAPTSATSSMSDLPHIGTLEVNGGGYSANRNGSDAVEAVAELEALAATMAPANTNANVSSESGLSLSSESVFDAIPENTGGPSSPRKLEQSPTLTLQFPPIPLSPRSDTSPRLEEVDYEKFTPELFLEELASATRDGIGQKTEIDKIRKQEKMDSLMVNNNMSNDELRKKGKSWRKSLRSSNKSKIGGGINLTSPTNFRHLSQQAELVEMERIFLISKDFIESPSKKRLDEEKLFGPQLRQRIQQAKDLLSYELDLSSCQLQGIPTVLVDNFCKLRIIDLSNNQFKEFPKELRAFDALEELNLASNTISVIPSFIERIHKLRAIRFDDNQITSLPHEMAHLSLLEVLIMPGNGMSVVPKWIGHFQELRYLDLSRCPIVEIAAEIGNCKNLEVLDLSGGGKLVKLPKEICCLNNLRSLRLADNKIDKLPSNIGILSKLRELSVPNNRLVELPVSLGLCMELGTPSGKLELAGNPIIQKDLRNACERLGQIELFQFLHARTLSVKVKFDQYSPPKMGSLPKPAEKLSAKTVDKFTMQEKLMAMSDWAQAVTENYVQPGLVKLAQLAKAFSSSEDPVLLTQLVPKFKQLRLVYKRTENQLPPYPKLPYRLDPNVPEMEQYSGIMLEEMSMIDWSLRQIRDVIRDKALRERVEDIVCVVSLVHYLRDLMLILGA